MESDRKRRVLFTGEASFLATGFSTYWNEVIKRLHATGEFLCAEMGSYAYDDDPRCQQVPWKFYPVAPARNNQRAMQQYMSNPTNQFGEWRFDDVCLDFRPDLVIDHRDFWMQEFIDRSPFRKNFTFCVDPQTIVLTSDGTKKIGDISSGDTVLTHRGKSELVTAIKTFKTNKSMVSIRPSMWFEPILATSDHKFLAVKHSGRKWDKHRNLYAKNTDQYDISDAEWIEANELDDKDILIMPKEHINIVDPFIKMIDFTKRKLNYKTIHKMDYIQPDNKCHSGHWIKNHQIIDNDFALLCGYFLADGTASGNLISFSFGEHETKYIDDVLRIIKQKFGITGTAKKVKDEACVEVYFCSVLLKDLFSNFYTSSDQKIIPKWLLLQPNQIISWILYGWLRGDGCLTSTCHDQSMIEGFTSSYDLAIQLFRICCRLELAPNIIRRNAGVSKIDNRNCPNIGGYRLQFHGSYARTIASQAYPERVDVNFSKKSRHRTWFDKNGNLLTQIKSIIRNIDHDGMVCDITVENDHSFLVPFIAHNCAMPTIDGEPQRELWLDMYKRCDGVLTYSKYGMDLLKKTGRRGTNLITIASPGADLEIFKPPHNKREHKAKLGIDPNSIIIGTVMRNQKRKLYYDLIEAFSMWLHRSKTKGHIDLANRTFLYLHTSYPDVGYDIGKAIMDFKIGNKVIMTYLCSNCQTAYPSFFSGEMMVCRKCGQLAAHPPNASHSCPRNVLADIMKTFDLYVQYSIAEGWGMPCTEAMACGIPVAAVDYSAMQDHLLCPTSIPIEVERFFWEAIIETEQRRALPSNKDFVSKLDKFLKQSEAVRNEKSKQTRAYIEELIDTYGQNTKMRRYSWERTAAIWGQVIRETVIKDQKTTWLCPTSRVHHPNLIPPSNDMNNSEFVNWVIGKIWNRPDMLRTHFAGEWLKSLNSGSKTAGDRRVPFNRKDFVDHFVGMVQQANAMEEKRLASLKRKTLDQVNVTVL